MTTVATSHFQWIRQPGLVARASLVWMLLIGLLNSASAQGPLVPSGIENISVGLTEIPLQLTDETNSHARPARNVFKVGLPAPVAFDLVGAAGQKLTAWLRSADADGRAVEIPLPEVTLPATGRLRFRSWFRSGKIEGPLLIQLRDSDHHVVAAASVPVSRTAPVQALPQSAHLVLVLGEHRLLPAAARRWNSAQPDLIVPVSDNDPTGLSWTPSTLAAVDVVIARNFASITSAQAALLRDWVSAGGRLVLSLGEQTTLLRASPLADWLPALPVGETDVASLQSLNDAVSSPNRLLLTRANRLAAAQLDRSRGKSLADSLTGSLILRSSYGAGTVTMLGISLDEEVLVNWDPKSQADLLALLSGLSTPWQVAAAASGQSPIMAGTTLDVTDLQTQLQYCVDDFPEIPRITHWHVLGWIFAFAVLAGPVDFFVVHFWLKRPALTWFTLPVWVLLASLLIIWQSSRVSRQPAASRQLDVVDVDAGNGDVRVHSWRAMYQPVDARFDMVAKPAPRWLPRESSLKSIDLGPAFRPEAGFRGIYRSGGINDALPGYQLSEKRDSISNFPFATRSSTLLASRWNATAPSQTWATSQLKMQGDNRLTGSFEHHLPGSLTDWLLAYSDFAYEPRGSDSQSRSLAAGSNFEVDEARSAILEGRLRGLRQVTEKDDTKDRVGYARDEYNPLARESLEVVRMITFYSAAGGESYTHLFNHSVEKLDLSRILELNHAVLFGRLQIPATEITAESRTDQNAHHDVFVRLLLPVDRGS